jgi:hypothetical protein
MASLGPSAGRARQSSRARGILVLDGRRSADRSRRPDVTSKLHEIRVRDDSVGDLDEKIISRIASASLRHKNQVPAPSWAERVCATEAKATRHPEVTA